MFDGNLMTVEVTANLKHKEINHHCTKADPEGVTAEIWGRSLQKLLCSSRKVELQSLSFTKLVMISLRS